MENWQSGYVDIELDEMVKCVSETNFNASNQPIVFWIENESDKIAPPHTLHASEKRKMHQFYMQLLKQIQQ